MQSDFNQDHSLKASHQTHDTTEPMIKASLPPKLILERLYAFAPNRETLGATSYFIVENTGNILIDCPAWGEVNQEFLQQQGVRWLFVTHRGGIGASIRAIQSSLGCEVVIHEQEAYLLPDLKVTTFQKDFILNDLCYGFWTPGHSPGSACVYWQQHGGVLFTGRHLLPNLQGFPTPLRTAKTFHWPRQLQSVAAVCDRFTPETLRYLCPGANTGFLRGKGIIDDAYQSIMNNEQGVGCGV